MSEEVCGSTDTSSGEPCERPAGWGTDRDQGPCYDHEKSHTVPKKLTPKVKNRILGALRDGAAWRHAAMVAGIQAETLKRWRKEGEKHVEGGIESELAELYRDVQRARGAGALKRIQGASDEFVLERSYGYTKTEEQNVNVQGELGFSEMAETLREARKINEERDA